MIVTRVHRTEIPIAADVTAQRLRGYLRAVHVAAHRSKPDHLEIWYEAIDIDEDMQVRWWVHGTGLPFTHQPDNAPHVGTVMSHGGRGVWHVYAEYPLEERIAGSAI